MIRLFGLGQRPLLPPPAVLQLLGIFPISHLAIERVRRLARLAGVAYWDAEHLDDVYTTGDRPPKTPPYQQVQKPSRQRVVSTVLRTGGGKKRDPAYWDPEHLATIHSP